MDNFFKENGNTLITVPLLLAVGTICIGTLSVLLVNIFSSFIIYEKLLVTTLKYMFILEEYGYLTSNDKDNIINELEEKGFNKENIQIDCTESIVKYGEQVYLNIKYNHLIKFPFISGENLNILTEDRYIKMNITKYGVSKI